MTVCILTPPCNYKSDFGLLFITPAGYINMCGHAVMGASVSAIEMGIIEPISLDDYGIITTLSHKFIWL